MKQKKISARPHHLSVAGKELCKGDATRCRILDIAIQLISDKGPDAVSMRELAQKLKLTKPVLYYYFKYKEELIKEAFLEGTRELRKLEKQAAGPNPNLEERIASVFSAHLEFFRAHPQAPRCALKIFSAPSES